MFFSGFSHGLKGFFSRNEDVSGFWVVGLGFGAWGLGFRISLLPTNGGFGIVD